MPKPLDRSLFHFHLKDFFSNHPRPAEEIQAMAQEALQDVAQKKGDSGKLSLAGTEIQRIRKYAADEKARSIANEALTLAMNFSTRGDLRLALYGAALTVLSHPLGATMTESLSVMAAEALKNCEKGGGAALLGPELTARVKKYLPGDSSEALLHFLEKAPAETAGGEATSLLQGGFRALAHSTGRSPAELFLESARHALTASAPGPGRAAAALKYFDEFKQVTALESGRVEGSMAPIPIPLQAGPVTAVLEGIITAIRQDINVNAGSAQSGSPVAVAYCTMLAELPGDPAFRSLASAASMALTAAREAPAAIIKEVISAMNEQGTADPMRMFTGALQRIAAATGPREGANRIFLPFFKEMEGYCTAGLPHMLISAGLQMASREPGIAACDTITFKCLADALASPGRLPESSVVDAARKAMAEWERESKGAEKLLVQGKEKIGRAFLGALAGEAPDPAIRKIALTILQSLPEECAPAGARALESLFHAPGQGALPTGESGHVELLHHSFTGTATLAETAAEARIFTALILEESSDGLVQSLARAALGTDSRRCLFTSDRGDPSSFPNSDYYSFKALSEFLLHPDRSGKPEQVLARLALQALAPMEKNGKECYSGGLAGIARAYMQEIARISSDSRIQELADFITHLSESSQHGNRALDRVINEAFSLIAQGLDGRPGQEFKALAEAAAGSAGTHGDRERMTRLCLEQLLPDPENLSADALFEATATVSPGVLYDSHTALYLALADSLSSGTCAGAPEQVLAALAEAGFARYDLLVSPEVQEKSQGKANLAMVVLKTIEGVTSDPVMKAIARAGQKGYECQDRLTHTRTTSTGSYGGGSGITYALEPRHDGPRACAHVALQALGRGKATLSAGYLAGLATKAMTAAETPEGRANAARPFIELLAPLVKDPLASSLLKLPEHLPVGKSGDRDYASEEALYRELAATLAGTSKSVQRYPDEPVPVTLARKALAASEGLPPVRALVTCLVYAEECVSQMHTGPLAEYFKGLRHSGSSLEQQVQGVRQALGDLVEAYDSFKAVSSQESNVPEKVEFTEDDSGKSFIDIEGIRLQVREEKGDCSE